MSYCACCNSKKRDKEKVSIGDINLDILRLSNEEKKYYKNLFLNLAENELVCREVFPELMGVLGTNISAKFALRIFDVFAKDKNYIRLDEYLKYVDLYHHGNERERCFFTFQLMDESNDKKVDYKEFKNYIENIIVAVNIVHPSAQDELLSENEIRILFDKISNNKDFFVYKEFEELYKQKPLLLSWIDYFKNNDADFLIQIDKNIKMLFCLIERFTLNMQNIFESILDLNGITYEFKTAIDEIRKFCNVIEKKKEKFVRKTSAFNLKSLFDNFEDFKEFKHIIKNNEMFQRDLINDIGDYRDAKSDGHKDILKNIKDKRFKENPITTIHENVENNLGEYNLFKFKKIHTQTNLNKYQIANNYEKIKKSEKFFVTNSKNDINSDDEFIFNENPNVSKFNSQERNAHYSMNEDQKEAEIENLNKSEYLQENFTEYTKMDKVNNEKPIIECGTLSCKSQIFTDEIIIHELDKYSNNSENFINEKIKYNTEIKQFLTSQVDLLHTNIFILKWISASYKWLENHYLKNSLKREKTKSILLNKVNKPIEVKKRKKKLKNESKDNTLKIASENFEFLLNMMMGIQMTVNSTSNINLTLQTDVKPYLKSYKYSLPSVNFSSNINDGIYSISSYASVIFHNIRKSFGIDKEIYIQSISPQELITEMMISSSTIIEELFSTSKSGSLFYHTRDGKYILKTISDKEYKCIKHILPSYFRHIIIYKDTLLPKFYSCHKLIKKIGKKKNKFYFIIMDNIFSTNLEIHLKYDLKGSKIGREVLNNLSEEERSQNKFPFALKDLDLDMQNKKFYVDGKYDKIIKQLIIDTEFLKDNKIIDYSLLIGIHRIAPENKHTIDEMMSNVLDFKNVNCKQSQKILDREAQQSIKQNIFKNNSPQINRTIAQLEKNIDKYDDVIENKLTLKAYSISTRDFDYSVNEKDIKLHLKRIHTFQDLPDGGVLSSDGTEIYYIGIIDVLTKFGCTKKMEFLGKLIYHCSSKISVAPPKFYRERFIKYISDIFNNK